MGSEKEKREYCCWFGFSDIIVWRCDKEQKLQLLCLERERWIWRTKQETERVVGTRTGTEKRCDLRVRDLIKELCFGLLFLAVFLCTILWDNSACIGCNTRKEKKIG